MEWIKLSDRVPTVSDNVLLYSSKTNRMFDFPTDSINI